MQKNDLLHMACDTGESKNFSDKRGKSEGTIRQPYINDTKPWLILSNGFNMDGRAASQTITDKIPHLVKLGVRPIVVSTLTGEKDQKIRHYQIPPLTPVGLRFDLRHFLRQRLQNKFLRRLLSGSLSLLILPFYLLEKAFIRQESQWSWFISAFLAGTYVIKTKQPILIYSTGGPNSAHFAAYMLSRRYRLPWIAEIHDPMVAYNRLPETQRERFASWLEEKICRHADVVWWFTEEALFRAKSRHPELGSRGHSLIPGAEPPPPFSISYGRGKELKISHFGSLSRTRNLKLFLAALKKVIDRDPGRREVFRLHIYGAKMDSISAEAIRQFPYGEVVIEHGRIEHNPETGESGRAQVVRLMHLSDCLLLLHGNDYYCEEYIPSKMYEYFFARRPILALVWHNPQMEQMLREMGHWVAQSDDVDAITEALDGLYCRWAHNDLPSSEKPSPHTAEAAVETLYGWASQAIIQREVKSP
jgi:glycosyltransferase involved in cell wall biosynthesis